LDHNSKKEMMPAVGKGKKKDTAEENEYEAKRQW
jgi:hypothetical protein